MWFESLEAVKQLAVEDYEPAYAPPKAGEILARFDEPSQHYDIRKKFDY